MHSSQVGRTLPKSKDTIHVSSLTSPGHARLPLPAPVNMWLVLCWSSLCLAAACDCGECPGSPFSPRNDSDRTGLFELTHACLLQVPPVAGVLPAGLCPFCPEKAQVWSVDRSQGVEWGRKSRTSRVSGTSGAFIPIWCYSGHCGETLSTIELSLCQARNPSAMGLPWSCHWLPLAP